MSFNDLHGAIGIGRSDDPLTPLNEDDQTASVAEFASAIETARAEAGDANSVLISAGDSIGGSNWPVSAIAEDKPTVELMNALGVNAMALGNHELDRGYDWLKTRVVDSAPDQRAQFPILAANVRHSDGTPAFPASTAVQASGLQVCIAGAVTTETTFFPPAPLGDLVIGDPVAAINATVVQLEQSGACDVTVAVIHEGGRLDGGTSIADQYAASPTFKRMVEGLDQRVDALVTGHRHRRSAYVVPRPGAAPLPVVQAGEFGQAIGVIDLQVDAASGEVVGVTSEVRSSTRGENYGFGRVVAAKQVEDRARAAAEAVRAPTVATSSGALTRGWADGAFAAGLHTGGISASGAVESTAGHLVVDGLRLAGLEGSSAVAHLGLLAESSVRGDLPNAGAITFGDAYGFFPDELRACSSTLTGAQLRAVLEQQWRDGGAESRLEVSSNVQVRTNPAAALGQRVGLVLIDGAPLDPARSYVVATDNALCRGLGGFTAMRQGVASYPPISGRNLFIERYLKKVTSVEPDHRARQVATSLPLAVIAGTPINAEIGGLNLTSTGSPRNTSIKLFLSTPSTNRQLDWASVTNGSTRVEAIAPAGGNLVAIAYPSETVVGVPLSKWATRAAPRSKREFARDKSIEVKVLSDLSATGVVSLRLKGSKWRQGVIEDGVASVPFPRRGLQPGRYVARVKYAGDSNHVGFKDKVRILVKRLRPTLVARTHIARGAARLVVKVDTDGLVTPTGTAVVTWGKNRAVVTLRRGRGVVRLPASEARKVKRYRVTYTGDDHVARVRTTFAARRIRS